MNKPIFCFVGMSGSGKSTMIKEVMDFFIKFSNRKYKNLVYHTTRNKRKNEVDGVDYVFVDSLNGENQDNIIELRKYHKSDEGVVYYYTTYDDVNDPDIDAYVCAASVDQVLEYMKKLDNIYPIVLECPVKDRIIRTLKRCNTDEACLEICRRMIEERNEFLKIYDVENIFVVDNRDEVDLDMNIIKISHYIEDTLEEHI